MRCTFVRMTNILLVEYKATRLVFSMSNRGSGEFSLLKVSSAFNRIKQICLLIEQFKNLICSSTSRTANVYTAKSTC